MRPLLLFCMALMGSVLGFARVQWRILSTNDPLLEKYGRHTVITVEEDGRFALAGMPLLRGRFEKTEDGGLRVRMWGWIPERTYGVRSYKNPDLLHLVDAQRSTFYLLRRVNQCLA